MALPSDTWLAQLIETNIDSLADALAAHVQEHSAAHQTLDPTVVHTGFVAFYRALAAEIATGDPAPMRTHLQKVLPVRVQAGAKTADLVGLVDQLEAEVETLLTATDTADHPHVAAARPHLAAIHKNVRSLVQEIAG